MKPVVTVVTVCFNSVKTIEKTIKSVLEQPCEDYEYLIIDGLSSDGTLDVIKAYEQKFQGRLKYISEKDKGWYDAMNKGVALAEGSFINFLNSDDYFETGALKKVVDYIKANHIDENSIVYGDSTNVYQNSKGKTFCLRIHAPEKIDSRCPGLSEGMCGIRHQSMFTGKGVFQKVGLLDLKFRLHADWDFFIKSLKMNIPYYYLNENLTYYSMYGVSTRPNCRERHMVRKDNGLYKKIDIYYWKDKLGLKTIVRRLLGARRWNDFLFWHHERKNHSKIKKQVSGER